jgi:S-adenosylmethionine decarboxylase
MNVPLGHHSLLDYKGCDARKLTDTAYLRACMLDAVKLAGGTIVTDTFHTFSPHGVSGVVVIAESHVALHTWPEHSYAAVDVFSCGVSLNHDAIAEYLRQAFAAAACEHRRFSRGHSPAHSEVAEMHPAQTVQH